MTECWRNIEFIKAGFKYAVSDMLYILAARRELGMIILTDRPIKKTERMIALSFFIFYFVALSPKSPSYRLRVSTYWEVPPRFLVTS